MRPVSSRLLETIRGSHVAVFKAVVLDSFQSGVTLTGTAIDVVSGDVVSSATADVRSTLSLTTSASWPSSATDLLAPFGQEIAVSRGVAFGNAVREFVQLGIFRIDTPEQDDVPDGTITIAGSDRMAGIIDARFLAPRQFAAGLTRGTLVSTLIAEVYPLATIEWDDTVLRDGLVGRTVVTEDDRAGTLKDFITSLGKVGYFDYRGVFVVKTPRAVTGAPDWTVDAGRNGVLVQMSRGLTRDRVYNAVVAVGEAGDTTPPARGVAYNLDPASPTYYSGPFGPVPMFFSSPFLVTNAQALSAATSLLRKQLGLPYQVKLSALANPALEPLDVIAVKYPRTGRSLALRTETHVVDTVTIPLDPQTAVTLATREQTTELLG